MPTAALRTIATSSLLATSLVCAAAGAAWAAPQTWYFEGVVSAVNDVYGNGADDPTFASGGYVIGSPISGSVTIDPATASPDYDDPAALNLSGPDDPSLGLYLDAVTEFDLFIGSNHQTVDAYTWWSTVSSSTPIDGAVETIDDEDMGSSLWRDLYAIHLPVIGDEYVYVPSPGTSYYVDQNGLEPVAGEADVMIPSLLATEWIWQGTSSLVQGDDISLDLEGRTDVTKFYLRLLGTGGTAYDVRVTYDLTYLSATPLSQPPSVPLLGPLGGAVLASGVAAMGALAAVRLRRDRSAGPRLPGVTP